MDTQQIRRVRRFNRLITQRVGALQDSYLARGRSLGEARVLFETGVDGIEVRELRDRLGLDSGYLSRILRSLEAQGLVEVRRGAEDGRLRHVSLTGTGRTEHAAYERLSDELAASMLDPLAADEREQLAAAMAEVERLIRQAAVAVTVEDPAGADARSCLAAYVRELAERFESGFDPARSMPAREEEMTPPAGYFVVARIDGRAVGCGALKCTSPAIGEIKRMWTAPSARGQGVARRVLRRLEALAREAGLTTLHLETNRALTEAQGLYRREGYVEVAPFSDEAYAHHWFEKRL